MGWYFRKSTSIGPIRFNFSKSGIGTSIGIKGFRIGVDAKGKRYVHAGRGGLYFRQNLDSVSPSSSVGPSVDLPTAVAADLDNSGVLAAQLTQRAHLFNWAYIPLTFGVAIPICTQGDIYGMLAGAACAIAAFFTSRWHRRRSQIELGVRLPELAANVYRSCQQAFTNLAGCHSLWWIKSEAEVYDSKYHSGVASSLTRKGASAGCGQIPHAHSEELIPFIRFGSSGLYFMPHVLLVKDGTDYAEIPYRDVSIRIGQTIFVESGAVPSDAEVLGKTWQYVNRNGGPDRRFSNNPEYTRVRYGEITISSDSGLKRLIQVSNHRQGAAFVDAICAFLATASLFSAKATRGERNDAT